MKELQTSTTGTLMKGAMPGLLALVMTTGVLVAQPADASRRGSGDDSAVSAESHSRGTGDDSPRPSASQSRGSGDDSRRSRPGERRGTGPDRQATRRGASAGTGDDGGGADSETMKIHFLKPRLVKESQLYEMSSVLDSLHMVDEVRVDKYSKMLIVRCTAAQFPEVERLVQTLQAGEATGVEADPLRQVALDVKVILANSQPSTETHKVLGLKVTVSKGADDDSEDVPLDKALAQRLGKLFGYQTFRLLGTQLLQVKVGEKAEAHTVFKDPRSQREFPFELGFKVHPVGKDLEIRCNIGSAPFAARISTTFMARPNQRIILGNSALNTGEALIYLVTPREGGMTE